ncbi:MULTISPECIES: PilZ domain-containing protein [unclassified Sphingomonas]|uniref:PilZ domain-containing protein n=1 Tax=unclassified Sphingomonas TaxID=196159 RepID=UPI0018E554CE|nr:MULTISPECIES: PilZ domain-containing protein [unclassified Sphingomonas]
MTAPLHNIVPDGQDAGDRRSGQRHALVLLIGKVRQAGREAACLVHDISTGGLKVRFTEPHQVGGRLQIEVRGLPAVRGTVRWVNGCKAGVEFDTPQDISRVFCTRDETGHVMRTPRFAMEASGTLRVLERRFAVDILDVSPGGAKLGGDAAVQIGQAGSITLPDLGEPVFGVVCWAAGDRLGFKFSTPLSLDKLARVLGCH